MDNYIINIDSSLSEESQKKNIISTDFSFKLPESINNVTNLKLSSIELPNTSYLITLKKDNHYFKLKIDNNDYMITLNEGNYMPLDLQKIIEEKLKVIDDDLEIELVQYQYLFKIYHSKTKVFELNFTNDSDYNSLGGILGFENNTYQNSHTYKGEKMVYIIDNSYCFLYVNGYGHVHHNNKRYLSKIIITGKKYEMVYDGSSRFVSKNVIFTNPKNINSLNVRLEDSLGNLINLNSSPFSFTLEFSMIENQLINRYKKVTFYNQELMEVILNDVMLNHYTKDIDELKIGETYNKILKDNVVNHIYSEGKSGRVNQQIELINSIKGGVTRKQLNGTKVKISNLDKPVTSIVASIEQSGSIIENLTNTDSDIMSDDDICLLEIEKLDIINKQKKRDKKKREN